MRTSICVGIGAVGGFIATMLGGWDKGLETLVIFMAIDYISGFVVAGVFKRSPKRKQELWRAVPAGKASAGSA